LKPRKSWTRRSLRLEEQAKRDHRKIGKELGLSPWSKRSAPACRSGCPTGNVLRDELEHLARRAEHKAGYKRVSTPHITKGDLYHRSGPPALLRGRYVCAHHD
jgi:threonyl-tRNA synthetase